MGELSGRMTPLNGLAHGLYMIQVCEATSIGFESSFSCFGCLGFWRLSSRGSEHFYSYPKENRIEGVGCWHLCRRYKGWEGEQQRIRAYCL